MNPGCVYRMFDAAGALLYIGSCMDFDTRMVLHRSMSPWRSVTHHVDRTDYQDIAAARAIEMGAIAEEHPRWNIQYRDHLGHPDGPAFSHREVWLMHPGDVAKAHVIWGWTQGPDYNSACRLAKFYREHPGLLPQAVVS